MNGYGIDLGTANTVVCHQQRGVVLDEPSVMVVRTDQRGRRVMPVMVGDAARSLMGRCPVGLTTVRPLRDGVITDLESARGYIVGVLSRITDHAWQRIRPRAVIGVPAGATALERRALVEAAEEAGIRRVRLLPEPIAGALGCGIDPLEARAHMVVDLGGGTSEVTAFCYGGVLTHRSCRVAGDEMTLALFQYLRSEHQLIVGELTAELVKCQAGVDPNTSLVAQGMDAATGRPRLVTLGIAEVVDALRPTVDTILATLVNCLEDLPPQAGNDILENGVVAFGGGSLLRGFDKLLEDSFAFPVRLADRPLTCVAEGAAASLSRKDILNAFDGELVQPA
ncbi:MAG TPA: rod shape-determining protein [Jatrophihabitans sp.]|jgi:rod shape-determining protein MreB|nr:rod shape-determining protein [Jatrophihabitans sp.]